MLTWNSSTESLAIKIASDRWKTLSSTSLPSHLGTWIANGWAEAEKNDLNELLITFKKQLWDELRPSIIPKRINDSDDSFAHEVSVINELLGAKAEAVKIIERGFLGEKSFRILYAFSNESPIELSPSISPLERNSNSIPVQIFGLLRCFHEVAQSQEDFLAELGAFKFAAIEHSQMYENVSLSDFLNKIDVKQIKSFKPVWSKSSNGYNLNYLATVSAPDGTTEPRSLDPAELDPRGKFLAQGSQRYVLLTKDESQTINFARRTKRSQSAKQVASTYADPSLLVPTGSDPATLDLSEYNPNVIGFEVIRMNSKFEFSSSGVRWYRSDDHSVALLEFEQEDGSKVSINAPSITELSKLIPEVSRSLKNCESDPSLSPPAIEISGKLIKPTYGLLSTLTEIKAIYDGKAQESLQSNQNSSTGREAAVLAETDVPERPIDPILANLKAESGIQRLKSQFKLDDFQREGVEFLVSRYKENSGGAIIADDMGLGKTLQLLTFIAATRTLSETQKPVLVVAPLILLRNWQNEMRKFFDDGTFGKVLALAGDTLKTFKLSSNELNLSELKKYDLILTNYSTLSGWQKNLLRIDFGIVIFDESQALKNPDTNQSRAARGLKSKFTICSTGTPVENRLRDLWTQVDTLQRVPNNPLGPLSKFKSSYESASDGVEKAKLKLGFPGPHSIIIRREKHILKGLPKKHIVHEPLQMTPSQVALEKELISVGKKDVFRILQNLQKLYQHPTVLVPNSQPISNENLLKRTERLISESPKLEWLVKMLEQIEKKKERVLIFTLWCRMQDLLSEVLQNRFRTSCPVINGETNRMGPDHVDRILNEFSERDGFGILILSPLAAGAGLNITAANHVIHYGRWWNPAKEDQASDRAYRKGQTKDVFVYYPTLHKPNDPNSGFDIKLHQLVEAKRALARDFLAPSNDQDLSQDEINTVFNGAI